MSLAEALIPVGLELARLGIDAAQGKAPSSESIARQMVELGLRLVPHAELQKYLTEAGRERGEILADVAEAMKFGKFGDDLDEDDGR